MATNWSSPKTNYFAALNDLRNALASGYSAKLVKKNNEDCEYPIRIRNKDLTFRSYESSGSYMRTRSEILADASMSNLEKEIVLNYYNYFGTEEAIENYYKTGELSADNFKGMGRDHLVKITDMIEFLERLGNPRDKERIEMLKRQYITLEEAETRHFYVSIRIKRSASVHVVKHFKHKLWVVELTGKAENIKMPFMVKIMNGLYYPLKFIPKHSVLRMTEYSVHTFRVGAVTNGFAVEFHIPKKFGFK